MNAMVRIAVVLGVCAGTVVPAGTAQQPTRSPAQAVTGRTTNAATGDPDYRPLVERPAYPRDQGPRVLIDEGHHNAHTATGRYRAFASILEQDGYQVEPSRSAFTAALDPLLRAFGVEGDNGYVMAFVANQPVARPIVFRRADGSLRPHPIIAGRNG